MAGTPVTGDRTPGNKPSETNPVSSLVGDEHDLAVGNALEVLAVGLLP